MRQAAGNRNSTSRVSQQSIPIAGMRLQRGVMICLSPIRKNGHERQERAEFKTYLSVQFGPSPGARGVEEGDIKEK